MGISIIDIDEDNIDTILPTLPFADNIFEDITNAVNQGLVVTITDEEIDYEDWTGIGYKKEDSLTGEAGWMLSGVIAGGMSVWGPERWPEYEGNILKYAFAEPPNYDKDAGRYILKITGDDLQKGIVGNELDLPLEVYVMDRDKFAVKGATVVFSVKQGGGILKGKDSEGDDIEGTEIAVKTEQDGIAKVTLTLGQNTSDNPAFWLEEDYTYSQQVGVNVVDAKLESGLAVTAPFTAYAFPDNAVEIMKLSGDGGCMPP